MCEFYPYKHKKLKQNETVIQKPVLQGKTFQFRADSELREKIENHVKEVGTDNSTVIRNILWDFFIDSEQIEWQKEVTEW